MSLFDKQAIFSANLAKLITYANTLGFDVSVREVQRTSYQQAEYLRTGKSKTSNSKHLDSLAADCYFMKGGKLCEKKSDTEILGKYWESLDSRNRWGGNFKSFQDCPHFEFGG